MDVKKMCYVSTLDVESLYSRNGVRMNPTLIKVAGIIIPTGWNNAGVAIQASIFTNDEQEYVIENTKMGRELLHFLRRKVVISGQLSERDGKRTIRVADFSVPKQRKEGTASK